MNKNNENVYLDAILENVNQIKFLCSKILNDNDDRENAELINQFSDAIIFCVENIKAN